MAHFAKINSENIVEEVIVVNNDILKNSDGEEVEQLGIEFCQSIFGEDTRWVQTSYNNSFRGRYAGPGFYWDEEKQIFRGVVEVDPDAPLPDDNTLPPIQ
jgi:hypothetical protein